jgi:CRISPR-associated endonuclease/helicase Cas3
LRLLKSARQEGGPPLALLHSRFPQYRREELETEWLARLGKRTPNRPNGCVLVATQVVEQSVDIDADLLVSDLAPTDMLLQRLGRLWRHDRTRPQGATAELIIHIPAALAEIDHDQAEARQLKEALGPSGWVYAPYVLLRSHGQWQKRSQITLPKDIRTLLEATYAEAKDEPPGWCSLRQELEQAKEKLRRDALSNTCVWNQPALKDDEGVQTRYCSLPTAQLLLATRVDPAVKGQTGITLLNGEFIEAADYGWGFPAAKAMHWNLVRMPRHAVAPGLRNAPAWLGQHISGVCALGLVRGNQIFWPGSDEPSGLTWHPDEGVAVPRQQKTSLKNNLEEEYESYD